MPPVEFFVRARESVRMEPPLPPPPPPSPPPRSDEELNLLARGILKTGDRRGLPDQMDPRMDAFARQIAALDNPADRVRLVEFILQKDSNAPYSWLELGRLDNRVEAGQVTAQQRAAVIETLAGAYLEGSGDVNLDTVESWLIFPDSGTTSTEIQQRIDTFIAGLPPEQADAFRQQLGEELIQREIEIEKNGVPRQMGSLGATGVFTLAQTSEGRQQLADLYVSLSAEDRNALCTMLARDGELYFGTSRGSDADSGFKDPLAVLIDSVALQRGEGQAILVPGTHYVASTQGHSVYDDAAIDLAHWAHSHQDHFIDGNDSATFNQRSQAMAMLLSLHDDALLNNLTNPQLYGDTRLSNGDEVLAALPEAQVLGTLLRNTYYNPDISEGTAQLVSQKLAQYGTALNGPDYVDPTGDNPRHRAGVLLFAMQDGVAQQYHDAEQQRAAQERFVGFFYDWSVGAASQGVEVAAPALGGPAGAAATIIIAPLADTAGAAVREDVVGAATDALFGQVDTSDIDAQYSEAGRFIDNYVSAVSPEYRDEIQGIRTDLRQDREAWENGG